MIIIADSGSTKTDWVILYNAEKVIRKVSIGLNPIYRNKNEIIETVNANFNFQLDIVTDVFFYGAGCMQFENSSLMLNSLKKCFKNANVVVKSDIDGAAISLFNCTPGIACILGTGSNIGVYDGKSVFETKSGLGYILGDEGSGAYLGKELVKAYLNEVMPMQIRLSFELEYGFDKSEIISSVYNQSNSNLFLAQFSKYIFQNINSPYFTALVKKCFRSLFDIHLLKINEVESWKLGFVGSIAFYFQDILKEIALEYGLKVDKIIHKPIDGLLEFHRSII